MYPSEEATTTESEGEIHDTGTSDNSSQTLDENSNKSLNAENEDVEQDMVMEVSFDDSDENLSDISTSESEEEGTPETSESESDGEADLNCRIAIANIGKNKKRKGETSAKAKGAAKSPKVQDPAFSKWINEMVQKQLEIEKEKQNLERLRTELAQQKSASKKAKIAEKAEKKAARDAARIKRHNKKYKKDNKKGELLPRIQSKNKTNDSPSQETLYAPALNFVSEPKQNEEAILLKNPPEFGAKVNKSNSMHSIANTLATHLSEFLDKVKRIQIDQEPPEQQHYRIPKKQMSAEDRAMEAAEKDVIDSEKFKAEVNSSGGKAQQSKYLVPMVDYSVSDHDSDFFAMTCHVEESIKEKIRRGEFIELEKLLAKKQKFNERKERHLEFVNKDGHSYLVQGEEKEGKIFSYRKWEQAFRVYAQIYSDANPHRCAEIWQYVDSIHSASVTFAWENVAMYDYDFRRLMAKKPQRCWAMTSTQLWTTYMRDHNSRNSNYNSNNKTKWGPDGKDTTCCWKYNRNKCKRSAQNCRYAHKCSYCGSYSHIYLTCPKRATDKKDGGDKNSDKSANK